MSGRRGARRPQRVVALTPPTGFGAATFDGVTSSSALRERPAFRRSQRGGATARMRPRARSPTRLRAAAGAARDVCIEVPLYARRHRRSTLAPAPPSAARYGERRLAATASIVGARCVDRVDIRPAAVRVRSRRHRSAPTSPTSSSTATVPRSSQARAPTALLDPRRRADLGGAAPAGPARRCANSSSGSRRISTRTARSRAASTRAARPGARERQPRRVHLPRRRVLPAHGRQGVPARDVAARGARGRVHGLAARSRAHAGVPARRASARSSA